MRMIIGRSGVVFSCCSPGGVFCHIMVDTTLVDHLGGRDDIIDQRGDEPEMIHLVVPH